MSKECIHLFGSLCIYLHVRFVVIFSHLFLILNINFVWVFKEKGTAVVQWLRCCATDRKAAGSIPDGVIGIFQLT